MDDENLRYSAGAMYVTPAPDNNHYGAYYNFENSKKVCPENWHLPSKDEYQALTYVYTYSTFQNPPANFILSGIYQNGSGMEGIDEEGVYRTSSQGNPGGFYYFGLFTGSGVNLSNYPPYGVDYFGYNVRCIADNS